MSISVAEKFFSPEVSLGENPTCRRTVVIQGSSDDAEIGAAFTAWLPLTFEPDDIKSLVLKSYDYKPIGYELWEGVAQYGAASRVTQKETGESTYSFETSNNTIHITQSLATTAYAAYQVTKLTPANVEVGDTFTITYSGHSVTFTATAATTLNVCVGLAALWNAATWTNGINAVPSDGFIELISSGVTTFTATPSCADGGGANTQTFTSTSTTTTPGGAPNFGGAIGVTKDGVSGCDVMEAAYHFSETHYVSAPDGTLPDEYIQAVYDCTVKTNAATFKGFSAGEVLFLGARGTQRGLEDFEIDFRFAAKPNVTGLRIGSLGGIAKGGWQYLWVFYKEYEDTVSKVVTKVPRAVYVETVYDSADMSALGIGT